MATARATCRANKRQVSAYCVIDNDFRSAEFRNGAAGNAANKVTLAHEFHHAIQFAYDAFENRAMMEGTATWMEDEVFTSINDNRQYLRTSPLGSQPWQQLDRFFSSGPFALWPYGTWIWYRFLSENLGAGDADSPVSFARSGSRPSAALRTASAPSTAALAAAAQPARADDRVRWVECGSSCTGHYREGDPELRIPASVTPIGNAPLEAHELRRERLPDVRALE